MRWESRDGPSIQVKTNAFVKGKPGKLKNLTRKAFPSRQVAV